MKDAEDEAFDDIARRQGAWGGGFKAKQDMAMHKTQDQNICRHYKQWQHCHICDLESQAAELAGIKAILDEYGLQAIDFVADFKAALAQPPPQREWVGLTEDEMSMIGYAVNGNEFEAMRLAEAKLKEKNT